MTQNSGPNSSDVAQAKQTVEAVMPVFAELRYRRDFVEKSKKAEQGGIAYGANWLKCTLYNVLLDNPDLKQEIELFDETLRKTLKDHHRLYLAKKEVLETYLTLHPDVVTLINDKKDLLLSVNEVFQQEVEAKANRKKQRALKRRKA